MTSDAKNLIDRMMSVDPEKRITSSEALDHPWISQREVVASHSERNETIDQLKKFLTARSRFRAAVFATIVARRTDLSKDNSQRTEITDQDTNSSQEADNAKNEPIIE